MGVAKIADLLLQTNFTELHTLIIAISSYVLFALYHVSHSLLDDNTEMHVSSNNITVHTYVSTVQ